MPDNYVLATDLCHKVEGAKISFESLNLAKR